MGKEITRLVIASHNPGKVREIAALLDGLGLEAVSADDSGLPEPEETETTFVGNALLKARAAARAAGCVALADDSGLAVDALDGAPGVYSKRWAGPDGDFSHAMRRLWEALPEGAPRSAHFVCVLALAWPDGREETFEGIVEGNLVWPPRGENGFGYDPIFVPAGGARTFGEMEPGAKHDLSHRARAFEKLVAWLRTA
jgi:XTP/dITP diphosphohydrolase